MSETGSHKAGEVSFKNFKNIFSSTNNDQTAYAPYWIHLQKNIIIKIEG